mgnify:FL=1
MGLDCYVNVKATDEAGKEEVQEIWYGRKENEIHGWMQRQSGVPADDFNCVEFPLTAEILDSFEAALKDGMLVSTTGFFFCCPNAADLVTEAAKDLLAATRNAISEGREPYYYSWW